MSHTSHQLYKSQARNITESAVIGIVLTGLSYFVGLRFGWLSISDFQWLEAFAVLTAYSSTYLCVVERRINYPIGAISSAAYAYLFIQNGLLSSAILNAYLVPTLIYGWIRWRKDINTRPVHNVSLRWIPAYLGIAAVGCGGAALISQQFGGALAWTDAVILAGTILAQFMLDNKILQNWIIWAIVNVFAIYTYATTGLPLVAFQYVFFLGNTIYGYVMWRRSMNHVKSLRSDDGDATDQWSLAAHSIR